MRFRKLFLFAIAVMLAVVTILPAFSYAATVQPTLTSLSATENSISLSWGAVDKAHGYIVRWGLKGIPGWNKTTTEATSFKITGNFSKGDKYAVQVCGYYKSGTTVLYTAWSNKTYVTIPGNPQMPVISKLTYNKAGNSVTCTWGSDDKAEGFEVSWARDSFLYPWGTPEDVGKATSYTASSSIYNDTTMAFRVRAYWWEGSSLKYTDWSDRKTIDIPAAEVPRIPQVTLSATDDGKVIVQWDADKRATAFEIRWGKKDTLGWPYGGKTSASSYTATQGLVAGTYYTFQVRALYEDSGKTEETNWSDKEYIKVVKRESSPITNLLWGPWSKPSTTRREITNTKTMQERIMYRWWAAKCKSCGAHNPYWGSKISCRGCGKKLPASNVSHVIVYTLDKGTLTKVYGRDGGRVIDGEGYWFDAKNNTQTYYSYRYRIDHVE